MPTLKDVLTTDEYKHTRKLQLELLESTTKKEASIIRSEIDLLFQQAKTRYFQRWSDEQDVNNQPQYATTILPFKLR